MELSFSKFNMFIGSEYGKSEKSFYKKSNFLNSQNVFTPFYRLIINYEYILDHSVSILLIFVF